MDKYERIREYMDDHPEAALSLLLVETADKIQEILEVNHHATYTQEEIARMVGEPTHRVRGALVLLSDLGRAYCVDEKTWIGDKVVTVIKWRKATE